MKAKEVLTELETITLRVYRLRLRTKSSPWFGHLMKAIEQLLRASKRVVEETIKVTR
jgi:hypothetical protein